MALNIKQSINLGTVLLMLVNEKDKLNKAFSIFYLLHARRLVFSKLVHITSSEQVVYLIGPTLSEEVPFRKGLCTTEEKQGPICISVN
jgi:hypothetical protein